MPNHQCELLTKSSESRVILLPAVLSRSVRCRLRSQNVFDASAKNCTWVYMYHVNHASYTGLGLEGVAWGEETILLSRILYQVGYPSCSMSMSHFEEEMQLVKYIPSIKQPDIVMKMIRTHVAEFCPGCSNRKPIDTVDPCVLHLLSQYFKKIKKIHVTTYNNIQ